MIPLAIITGFLGSGKTTLLKRIIETHRGRKLAYLVNEFSALDVDSRRLAESGENIVCLPGGSIFCRCLVTSFINQLKDIAEFHHSEDSPLEGLVVEASGVTDPRVASKMLQETGLDGVYQLARMVCMIDPGTFPVLLQTLPNIVTQVEAADLAIINKADLFDEVVLADVERSVREIQPRIEVVRAEYAAVDLELLLPAARPEVAGNYAPCRDDHYDTEVFATEAVVDVNRLVADSVRLLDDVHRVKGFVWNGRESYDLDWSPSSRMKITPGTSTTKRTELTAIFPPTARTRVETFFSKIGACES